MTEHSSVGKNVPRKEVADKLTGRTRYVDDISFPDMLYGATVRSPVVRGTLERVTFRPARCGTRSWWWTTGRSRGATWSASSRTTSRSSGPARSGAARSPSCCRPTRPGRRAEIDLGEARAVLEHEINPIDDARSTVAYRRRVTGNLLEQFRAETH